MTTTDPVGSAKPQENLTPADRTNLIGWIKARQTPLSRAVYAAGMWTRYANLPVIPGVHRVLYSLHCNTRDAFHSFLRIFWYTPLFQSRLAHPTRRLYVYNGLPFITGPVRISLGEGCRVAGRISISGRTAPGIAPMLTVGDNVDLGWDSNIAVGRNIEIGNNVRLATGVYLLGYPGHPLDAEARAAGAMDTDDQVGDIVLEDDVWLGSRATVMAGVHIGRGTIVAAGSIVTKDLPPFVLAAGIPAVVKRKLKDEA